MTKYYRRHDDLPRRQVNEFDGKNPCSWEQDELNIRKKEYLLVELDRIRKEIEDMEEINVCDSRIPNNVPVGNTSDINNSITIPDELFDFIQVLQQAANSGHHQKDNWLQSDGRKCSRKDMYASIFRHVSESYCGNTRDKDSQLHPALHAMARLGMVYVRWCKGLVHPEDINNDK